MADEIKPAKVANLFVNEQGYIYADGAKICRLVSGGQVEFLNKGHRTASNKRGEPVTISPIDLLHLVNIAQPPPHPQTDSQED